MNFELTKLLQSTIDEKLIEMQFREGKYYVTCFITNFAVFAVPIFSTFAVIWTMGVDAGGMVLTRIWQAFVDIWRNNLILFWYSWYVYKFKIKLEINDTNLTYFTKGSSKSRCTSAVKPAIKIIAGTIILTRKLSTFINIWK